MQVVDDKSRAVEQIRTYAKDIEAFDSRIKTLSEMVKDIVENTTESQEIAELEELLKQKKAQLKSRLMGMQNWVDATQELADERDAKKSAQKHLSDALVVFFTLTGEGQVELEEKHAREVIVSAKLGKEQLYQTNMFAEARNDR